MPVAYIQLSANPTTIGYNSTSSIVATAYDANHYPVVALSQITVSLNIGPGAQGCVITVGTTIIPAGATSSANYPGQVKDDYTGAPGQGPTCTIGGYAAPSGNWAGGSAASVTITTMVS